MFEDTTIPLASNLFAQLACKHAVVRNEVSIYRLETFLTKLHRNLSAVIARMINQVDHNHLHIVHVWIARIIMISEFAIEIIGLVYKLKPFLTDLVGHVNELQQ